MAVKILHGDCRDVLKTISDESVHCVVTSPPYFGLRDYGVDGQMGLEPTPDEFVAGMVDVFREVKRVLRDDGTLWLNLGDSYASSTKGSGGQGKSGLRKDGRDETSRLRSGDISISHQKFIARSLDCGLPDKNLIGIPWRVAFALQADGWYLRQDIIWHKPNPMPESVRDRCTKAHEYVFMLSKSPRYFFNTDAISEPALRPEGAGNKTHKGARAYAEGDEKMRTKVGLTEIGARDTRTKRSVWSIATQPFAEAHFATMAPELADTCIKAGCPENGTVLDPFGGAGTTGLVAARLQRNAILIELNPEYAAMAERRIFNDAPLFSGDAA
jgi:DNA modification methylase